MHDIYGMAPFQTQEKKITSRDTEEQAVNFAKNLSASGYTNLRVREGEPGPAVKQVNPPVDFRPQVEATPTQAESGSAGTPGGGETGGTAAGSGAVAGAAG